MKRIEEIYGIKADNSDLFKCALTHPSCTTDSSENYERLEFLGDAVLKLIISDILYNKFPDYSEGNLSKIRSVAVSDSTLSKIAHEIGLCELIIVPKHGVKQGIADLESVCACAFEAVLGAFYLDNKAEPLKAFLNKVMQPYIEDIDKNIGKYNAKAMLQEYTQSVDRKIPEYKIVEEAGLAHKKTFTIEVLYRGKVIAQGTGKTKKEAEQHAAYEACKKLGVL